MVIACLAQSVVSLKESPQERGRKQFQFAAIKGKLLLKESPQERGRKLSPKRSTTRAEISYWKKVPKKGDENGKKGRYIMENQKSDWKKVPKKGDENIPVHSVIVASVLKLKESPQERGRKLFKVVHEFFFHAYWKKVSEKGDENVTAM